MRAIEKDQSRDRKSGALTQFKHQEWSLNQIRTQGERQSEVKG